MITIGSPLLHLSSFVFSASENAITLTHSVSFSRSSVATEGAAMFTAMRAAANGVPFCGSTCRGSAARFPRYVV